VERADVRRRRLWSALAVASVAAGLAVGTSAASWALPAGGVPATTPSATGTVVASDSPGVSWPSGAYCGSPDPGCVDSFATWRGRPVTATTTFSGVTTWAALEGPNSWLASWSRNPYRSALDVTVPMLPNAGDASDPTPTLAEEASGDYDVYFEVLARRLLGAGMGSVTIRLGHELNGTWYSWTARPDPGLYAAAFRDVVTAMRSVPGTHFTFDWNIAVGASPGFDATAAYPGDAYVDTIGQDVYDDSWGQALTPQARWAKLVNPGGAVSQGLAFWADFAAKHGKPLSFAEWGLVGDGSPMAGGGAGGDDPYFIAQMHAWFASHDVAYEVYFNRNPTDGTHRIDSGQFPQAGATYQQLFGGSATASPTPSTTTPPSATASPAASSAASAATSDDPSCAPDLLVATSPSRSGGVPLCGSTVHGTVYVFATDATATAASFFVDNPNRAAAPTTLDLNAPYDLMGTAADGSAKPWDLSALPAGTHTVTVLLASGSGTSVQTATFTVTP